MCKKCFGPTTLLRFQAGDQPRIWFRYNRKCGNGSVVCSKGWRYLVPLWRTEEAYIALRHNHSNYEKSHWRWRDQWLVGPDNASNRPRRRGIGCKELRAQAALLLEWLLVCWRQGWLNGQPINEERPYVNHAERQLNRLKRSRSRKGLHLPRDKRQDHLAEIKKRIRAARRPGRKR